MRDTSEETATRASDERVISDSAVQIDSQQQAESESPGEDR